MKRIVNVNHDDALFHRFFADRHERFRIRRSDDDGAVASGNQIFHDADLPVNVGFPLDAERLQFDAFLVRVGFRALLHFQEKRVRERFHDEGDFHFISGERAVRLSDGGDEKHCQPITHAAAHIMTSCWAAGATACFEDTSFSPRRDFYDATLRDVTKTA